MREITAREIMHEGKMRWRVIIPRAMNSGMAGRRYFTGKLAEKRAKAYAASLDDMRIKAGVRILRRPHEEQVAIMHAADDMGPRVMEIGKAARLYMAATVALSVSVVQAVGECLGEKARGNLSPRYMRGIRSTLEKFALGKDQTPIDEISSNQVEDFINRLAASASRRSQLIDLRTLFSFALRRGYVRASVAALVAMPQRDELEPGILTLDQINHILSEVRLKCPEIMRFVALVLFGGVRPDEAKQLSENSVRDGYIEVPASISKTNRRRLIQSNETFLAWWNLGGALPLMEWQARKVREFVKPWPHDGLRHSFVSYHSALFGEVATSIAAGHSIAVMNRHYKALVTRAEAEKFWDIFPTS